MSRLRDLITTPELRGSTLTLVTQHATVQRRPCTGALLERQSRGSLERRGYDRQALSVQWRIVRRQRYCHRAKPIVEARFRDSQEARHSSRPSAKMGAGGLFFTLRTLPMIFDFVRDMRKSVRRRCSSIFRILRAELSWRSAATAGSAALGCATASMEADAGGRDPGAGGRRRRSWGAGLNHFQCLMQIRHRQTGEDLYPRLKAAEACFASPTSPLTRRLFRAFGYWLTCGDEHLGEYFSYGWEAGEKGYDFAADERWRAEFAHSVSQVLAGSADMPGWWIEPSGERGGAVIAATLLNQRRIWTPASSTIREP